MRRPRKPSGQITITLPRFLIIALREMLKDSPLTISEALESWLLKAITRKELDAIARRSPDFRREAEAWLRWRTRSPRK